MCKWKKYNNMEKNEQNIEKLIFYDIITMIKFYSAVNTTVAAVEFCKARSQSYNEYLKGDFYDTAFRKRTYVTMIQAIGNRSHSYG